MTITKARLLQTGPGVCWTHNSLPKGVIGGLEIGRGHAPRGLLQKTGTTVAVVQACVYGVAAASKFPTHREWAHAAAVKLLHRGEHNPPDVEV